MKTTLLSVAKEILGDRLVLGLIAALLILSALYCVYVGLSLRPSDLQVAVHYTAYGETHFYRDKWYYLVSFILFGILLSVVHTALIIKLYLQEQRQLAIFFGCLSLFMLIIAWIITRSVLRIAFL